MRSRGVQEDRRDRVGREEKLADTESVFAEGDRVAVGEREGVIGVRVGVEGETGVFKGEGEESKEMEKPFL